MVPLTTLSNAADEALARPSQAGGSSVPSVVACPEEPVSVKTAAATAVVSMTALNVRFFMMFPLFVEFRLVWIGAEWRVSRVCGVEQRWRMAVIVASS